MAVSKKERKQKKETRKKMSVKKKVLIGCAAVLVAVLAGVGIWKVAGAGKGGEGENVLYADSVGMLTGTGLGTQNRFAGVVEAQDTLDIALTQGQSVKTILVEKGQTVEAGTPLFQYDTEEISMNLDQAKLELERIANSIGNLYSQIEALNQEKAKAPADEQLSYTMQIQSLQTNIKQEEYNQKVKQKDVERIQKSLDSATVASTIGGIVQEINETPGIDNYTGEQQPFMRILATGKYRIKGTISEQNIGNLIPGMQVVVHSRVNEEDIWAGVVDSIDTEKPESSNQGMYYGGDNSMQATKYPFYITLESSDGLMLGQHVYIEPNLGQDSEKKGMWLMSGYIADADSGKPYVWAAGKGDKLEKREIKVGEYDKEMDTYEIVSGLKSSDYIVWPSEDCKKGRTVYKNEGGMSAPAGADKGVMEEGMTDGADAGAMEEGMTDGADMGGMTESTEGGADMSGVETDVTAEGKGGL